ncbi:MAG TPA: MATE family efflux transporter, partial [Candidatus Thermoplasmatota archaeon]|nr:MATE family efflux transporter [Candidatus Thermoplasmatota archaeon]
FALPSASEGATAGAASPRGRLRRILAIAWPVVVNNFLNSAALFVDVFLVAFLGATALASVGLASQVFFLAAALASGLSTGVIALTARAVGARDKEQEGRVVLTALLLAVLMSLPLAVLGFLYATELLGLLGASPEVAEAGAVYLRILSLAAPFEFFNLVATGVLNAQGRTRVTLIVNLAINAVHLLLDYVLIFGAFGFPSMGIAGAAVATAVSFGVGSVVFFALLRPSLPSTWSRLPYDGPMAARLFRVGAPSALEDGLLNFGFMVYTLLILGFGATALAAHQVGLRILSFAFMPGFGFSAAAAALVGQSLGAKDPEGAEQAGWYSMGLGLAIMVAMAVPLYLFSEPIAGLLSHGDPATLELSVTWIALITLTIPPIAIHFSGAGALRGAGDTRWTLLVSFVGLFALRIPAAYLLGFVLGLGIEGVWLAYLLEYYVRAGLTVARFHRGRWKALKI